MKEDGDAAAGDEGALPYLTRVASSKKPFFLVVSLVNPHDVLFYPNQWQAAGYSSADFVGDVQVPSTYNENLSTKPAIQQEFINSMAVVDKSLGNFCDPKEYINFYAYQVAATDEYVADVMAALAARGLVEDTLIIKTGDHGEMAMVRVQLRPWSASRSRKRPGTQSINESLTYYRPPPKINLQSHGGMREKNFNFYEEAIRVPLVFSNPKLFPRPLRTSALVSHVDLAPTLAALLGTPKEKLPKYKFAGRDYSSILLDPVAAKPIQDYVMFTYDDYEAGQAGSG
jgi:choline-sulfatase